MTNLDSIFKSRDITLPTKVYLVKAMVFPVVMYGCESWTVKKAEHRRIDAFEVWCWRRLLWVPWTARRSNQSILKEISPGCIFCHSPPDACWPPRTVLFSWHTPFPQGNQGLPVLSSLWPSLALAALWSWEARLCPLLHVPELLAQVLHGIQNASHHPPDASESNRHEFKFWLWLIKSLHLSKTQFSYLWNGNKKPYYVWGRWED